MKITMNIDDALLKSVMLSTGIKSKTGAVDHVLRDWDRRFKLKTLLENNLGLTEDELIHAFDPNYDVMELRAAETPATYGEGTRPD
jgi:Arc/MetJ family transcription regulator